MTLSPEQGLGEIAVINLIRNDFVPELSQSLPTEIKQAQLIVNLRAEAAPEQLEAALKASMEAMQASMPQITGQLSHLEHFRPGKPVPTHRLTSCP